MYEKVLIKSLLAWTSKMMGSLQRVPVLLWALFINRLHHLVCSSKKHKQNVLALCIDDELI